MTRERTREVIDKLAITVINQSGRGSGTLIERVFYRDTGAGSALCKEQWHAVTVDGIVANAGSTWLISTVRSYQERGPYWNKTQLVAALRAWRRGE